MAAFGMNVRQDGSDSPQALKALGVRWVRFKPTNRVNKSQYLKECQDLDMQVLLVIDGDSLTDFGPGGDNRGPLGHAQAAALYAARYNTLPSESAPDTCQVNAWEIGNEVEKAAEADWGPAQLKSLTDAFRAEMGNDAMFIAPGSDQAEPGTSLGPT